MKHANDGAGVISALIRAAKGVDIRIKKNVYLFMLEFESPTRLSAMKRIPSTSMPNWCWGPIKR